MAFRSKKAIEQLIYNTCPGSLQKKISMQKPCEDLRGNATSNTIVLFLSLYRKRELRRFSFSVAGTGLIRTDSVSGRVPFFPVKTRYEWRTDKNTTCI